MKWPMWIVSNSQVLMGLIRKFYEILYVLSLTTQTSSNTLNMFMFQPSPLRLASSGPASRNLADVYRMIVLGIRFISNLDLTGPLSMRIVSRIMVLLAFSVQGLRRMTVLSSEAGV